MNKLNRLLEDGKVYVTKEEYNAMESTLDQMNVTVFPIGNEYLIELDVEEEM